MKYFIYLPLVMVLLTSCEKEQSLLDDIELGQQLGSTMAAIDAGSGSDTGAFALLKRNKKTFARYKVGEPRFSIFPKAYAASCASASTFSSCTNNVIARDFDNCTVGSVSFSGNISITFDDGVTDNTCRLDSDGDTVTLDPDFIMTGRRNATLNVEKSGTIGQRITRVSTNTYEFTNDGIRRYFSLSGEILFDYSARTTSALTITGENRANRVLNGGVLQVTNNSTGGTCNMTPNNLTWDGSGSCNCPVSGNWSGSCSDERTITLTVNSCGSATMDVSGETQTVNFDGCY